MIFFLHFDAFLTIIMLSYYTCNEEFMFLFRLKVSSSKLDPIYATLMSIRCILYRKCIENECMHSLLTTNLFFTRPIAALLIRSEFPPSVLQRRCFDRSGLRCLCADHHTLTPEGHFQSARTWKTNYVRSYLSTGGHTG